MDDATFWSVIAAARRATDGETGELGDAVRDELARRPPEEILAWDRVFRDYHARSRRADLWGAGFLMNGGCSEDGFEYFRAWVIGQGKRVFEAALVDPDSLASIDVEDDEAECEELIYAAVEAWTASTGRSDDEYHALCESFPRVGALQGDLASWSNAGDSDAAKCRRMFPKLWKRFGGDEPPAAKRKSALKQRYSKRR